MNPARLQTPQVLIFGHLYSRLLNRVAGREEIAATFLGFLLVSASDLFWATVPFSNPAMLHRGGAASLRRTSIRYHRSSWP